MNDPTETTECTCEGCDNPDCECPECWALWVSYEGELTA